jgi:hypothetical protein
VLPSRLASALDKPLFTSLAHSDWASQSCNTGWQEHAELYETWSP